MRIHFHHSMQHVCVLPLQTSFGFTGCTLSPKAKLHRLIKQLLSILHRRSAQWTRWQPILSHLFYTQPAASMC
jgi:hypothetical protein